MVVTYTAWDTSSMTHALNDQGNHTLKLICDGAERAPLHTPTQVNATTAPGEYNLQIDAVEVSAYRFVKLVGVSATAGVIIQPVTVDITDALRGDGADTCTITVTSSGLPVADADVWVTDDSAGTRVVAGTLQTNGSGQCAFLLDQGSTYYLWLQKNGENSIQGRSFTAAASNAFTTTAASTPLGSEMTLTTARDIVRQNARNGTDTTMYSDAAIDYAIQQCCIRFCRMTKYLKAAGTVALTADSPAVDVSALSNFFPEQILTAHVSGIASLLDVIDWTELWALKTDTPLTGDPTCLAFSTQTQGEVYPTPSANATLYLRYWQPFTTWTPGAAGAGVILSLPTRVLLEILPFGAPWQLHFAEPEHAAFSASMKAAYEAIEMTYMGFGGLGAKSFTRSRSE